MTGLYDLTSRSEQKLLETPSVSSREASYITGPNENVTCLTGPVFLNILGEAEIIKTH